jgi:hypothetical protein
MTLLLLLFWLSRHVGADEVRDVQFRVKQPCNGIAVQKVS